MKLIDKSVLKCPFHLNEKLACYFVIGDEVQCYRISELTSKYSSFSARWSREFNNPNNSKHERFKWFIYFLEEICIKNGILFLGFNKNESEETLIENFSGLKLKNLLTSLRKVIRKR